MNVRDAFGDNTHQFCADRIGGHGIVGEDQAIERPEVAVQRAVKRPMPVGRS